ncbi:MAG: DUF4315 family protein [Ruminococcus sp.]|nr:DUF4315 family protein [Ruminococcus sp.]
MAALSPKKKISKLADDIAALEKTIKDNTRKLSELKEEKLAAENTEIITIIRKAGLSVEDIEDLIGSGVTQVQSKPKTQEDNNSRPLSAGLMNERKI